MCFCPINIAEENKWRNIIGKSNEKEKKYREIGFYR
jgi:hypothetical protein